MQKADIEKLVKENIEMGAKKLARKNNISVFKVREIKQKILKSSN